MQFLSRKSFDFLQQFIRWFIAVFQRNEGFYDFHHEGVGDAYDTRLSNRRMFNKGTFNLERTDEMTSRVNNVVSPSNKPEITVFIFCGPITSNIPVTFKSRVIKVFFIPVGPEH